MTSFTPISRLSTGIAVSLATAATAASVAAAAGEPKNQAPFTRLAVPRVLTRQRIELTHELGVLTSGQVSVDSIFERGKTKLVEARDFGLGETVVGEIRERRSSPERKCLFHAPLCLELPKPIEVELARLDPERVARRPALHALPSEQLPQLRNEDL